MDTQPDIAKAVLPSHTGLFRHETSLLRELFVFAEGDVPTTVNQLGDIEFGEGLSRISIKDVVFVAINVDTLLRSRRSFRTSSSIFGVSILSTQALRNLVLAPTTAELSANVIQSYQFTVGESIYCRRASRNFQCGLSDSIPLSDINARVTSIIPNENIVAIFHKGQCDAKALHFLNIDLHPICVIDTVKAAQYPLQLRYRLRLENLLKELSIPNTNLHAAGNGARFTLCALLMLVVLDAEHQGVSSKESLFQALRAFAQAPRPLTRQEIEKAERSSRLRGKREPKLRRKTRRAARTERRKQEREHQVAASEEEHSSDTESGGDTVK